jgi:hypothetical protein
LNTALEKTVPELKEKGDKGGMDDVSLQEVMRR